jgi:hypothetical protein
MGEAAAQWLARRMGLAKLDERHALQFARSIQTAGELAAKLPKDLHWSEEVALVLRLPNPPRAKP